MSFDQPRMVNRVKLARENVWSLFWSTLGLIVFFGGSLILASISRMGLSLNWVYNGSTSPLLSCPSSTFLLGANENVDGSHCKLLVSALTGEALVNLDPQITAGSSPSMGSVVYSVPCNVAINLINTSKCTLSGWGNFFPSNIAASGSNCLFNVMPVCDAAASVSVGEIITLRGLAVTTGFIIVLYFAVSLIALIRGNATLIPSRQRRLDGARNQAESSAREMSRMVEREWGVLESSVSGILKKQAKNSPTRFERGTIGGESVPPNLRDLFSSNAWKYKVNKSLGAEARARRNVALFLQKLRTGVAIWLIFFILTVATMAMLLHTLPVNYYTYTSRSLLSTLLWNQAEVSETVESGSSWIDFLAIADLGTEFVLLLFSVFACGIIQWPSHPVKVPHIVRIRGEIRRGLGSVDFSQAAADGAIYAETIGAVLIVRENCTSDHRKNSLVKRLQSLLTMFPPDSIFVVDSHGQSVTPVDSTWETVHGISPLIKYCFVPETDSKIFAMYWFAAVWFPFLVKSSQTQNLSHFLVIASNDDDGGILPLLPNELTIPRENLSVNADSLRALHLPVTAASGAHSRSSCFWVPWQDFDLKLKAVRRLSESRLGSCSEVELNVAIWEREALVQSLGTACSRDTSSPLHQMQRGLAVVKLRGRNHIKSNPFTFVNVCVPSKFTDLLTWRFRNNYAGDIVKAASALRELFSIFSLCNVYSWSIKFFLLFGTLNAGICQFVRPFVIGSLVFRDPIAIGGLAVVALVTIVLIEVVLFIVFSSRPDLRQRWGVGSILLYPLYRAIKCWFIELPCLFEYVLGGCVRNCAVKPEKRVRDLQDVPACPPCHVVNWFTVWKTEEDSDLVVKQKFKKNSGDEDELEDTMSSIPGDFRGTNRGG